MPENSSPIYPCGECQTGILRPRYITYFTRLNDELITVPNFPAWICDICGSREYDQRAISWLTILLNPNAGKKINAVQKAPPPQVSGKSATSIRTK